MKDKIVLQYLNLLSMQLSTNSYILYHILSRHCRSEGDYTLPNTIMNQLDSQQEISSKLAKLIMSYIDRG